MKSANNGVRFPHIDVLKAMGLLLIMLAHVSLPNLLFNLRTFDVPLMVILSGYLGFFSYQRHCHSGGSAWGYILKRCIRIAVPTWIFTFCLYIPVSTLAGNEYTFSDLVKIFLFQSRPMNYIWIALVYILSAVTIPVAFYMGVNKLKSLCIFICAYFAYEVLVMLNIGTDNALISSIVYQIIPYGMLTLIGMYMAYTNGRNAKWIATIAGIIFTAYLLLNGFVKNEIVPIQSAKYPATLYYLSYGVFISMLLFLLFEKKTACLFHCAFIRFISSSSYWIYLWHIMYVFLSAKLFPSMAWYLQFIIIALCSIGTVRIQRKCIELLRAHTALPTAVLSFFVG